MPSRRNYRISLTFNDETVDENYIPIFELFSNDKYALPQYKKEEWCISEKKIRKMRLDTFNDVKKRFELCNAESFSNFWNGNLDAINELSLNRFACITSFRELATAMICFEKTVKNHTNDKSRKMISWGIKRETYRKYYKSQLEALKTGEQPKRVSLYDSKKKRAGNLFKRRRTMFELGSNGEVVELDKNAVYYQFEHWCKIKGLEKKDGIYKAMLLLMEDDPVTNGELKELGAYERKCDLNYSEIIVPETSLNEEVKILCKVPKSIHTQMKEIISRYNADIDNIGQPSESIGRYVAQAIKELNENAPLKYSNPKAYEEFIKAKQAEEYNKRAINFK